MILRMLAMAKLAEMMEDLSDEEVEEVTGIRPGSTELDNIAFTGGAAKDSLGPVRPAHAEKLVEDQSQKG